MAVDPQGSRLLEALVKGVFASLSKRKPDQDDHGDDAECLPPTQSLLPHASVQQLVRSFQGHYAKAGLHPRGGFVVTAFYNAAEVRSFSTGLRQRKERDGRKKKKKSLRMLGKEKAREEAEDVSW